MDIRSASVGLDEATYFLNIAVIAGALIGLTFIALNLFMVDMLGRFKTSAFPVFRKRENVRLGFHPFRQNTPDSLTDEELLDGDPLVVFMAFSVAVSWNLFLLPLVIGLTAAWDKRYGALSAEMFVFSLILFFTFRVRNTKVRQLNPYLTREELLWPLISGAAFVLYLCTSVTLLFAAVPQLAPSWLGPSSWIWHGLPFESAADILIKLNCIASLVLGTYTVNKDMFIFFKAASAERMRESWLEEFLTGIYPQLAERVHALESKMPRGEIERNHLVKEWSRGPVSVSAHDSFREGSTAARTLWAELIAGGRPRDERPGGNAQRGYGRPARRSSVPVWLLDVPAIARWVSEIERKLQDAESA